MIYILTVYDSLNYGSYLQAFSLKEELSKYDDVCFLDVNHQSTLFQTIEKILAHIYKRRFKGIGFEIEKYRIFKRYKKTLRITKNYKNDNSELFVFGSDEIWNITRKKFLRTPKFFGKGIVGKKISYAPSLNEATKEDFLDHKELISELKQFSSISVRDIVSKEELEKVIDKKVDIVLDPTFLYGYSNFNKIEEKIDEDNYLMIYTYGKMFKNKQYINNVKEFAKKENLKIISVGKYYSWCDKSVNTTPFGFLGYIHNAKYVLTDTFHGTVFSIIYRKNFSVINPANKIKYLLRDFKLEETVLNSLNEFSEVKEVRYDYANQIQENLVNKSKNYLKESIQERR